LVQPETRIDGGPDFDKLPFYHTISSVFISAGFPKNDPKSVYPD